MAETTIDVDVAREALSEISKEVASAMTAYTTIYKQINTQLTKYNRVKACDNQELEGERGPVTAKVFMENGNQVWKNVQNKTYVHIQEIGEPSNLTLLFENISNINDQCDDYVKKIENYVTDTNNVLDEMDQLINEIEDDLSGSNDQAANHTKNYNNGLTQENIETMMNAAKSQLELPYYSMHYGPREGDGQGFGCAMFVSYCFNQALFNGVSAQERGLGGFYGSTYEYWGNVTNDGYNAYNKTFIEVPAEKAQPGDVVAVVKTTKDAGMVGDSCYDSYLNCGHVGLYAGDGVMYEASDGAHCVTKTGIDTSREDIRFLRYVGDAENNENTENDENKKSNENTEDSE